MTMGQPMSLAKNFCDCVSPEMRKILFSAQSGHELRILFFVPFITVNFYVEISSYFEHLREVFFIGLQDM